MTETQLTLERPESFRPVPLDTGHYVVALQSLSGEREALRRAAPETWASLTPLVQIVGPKQADPAPFKRTRVADWVKNIADCVQGHPCFLGTLRLKPNHEVETSAGIRPVLSVIADCAHKRGLVFVPVLRLGDTKATRDQICDIALRESRGVALRVPVLGTVASDGRSRGTVVKEVLDKVQHSMEATDLLLDLGFLSDDFEVSAELLATTINELVAVGNWRSVVLLGSSMPRSLGGGVVNEGTIGRLPRHEWEIWCALRKLQLPRLPTYGDYAVQHPDPPEQDQQTGPGMRANIRYTLDHLTLVPRGVGPFTQEGKEGYRLLCRQIVQDGGFAGPDFSWGDRTIAECADGSGPSGMQDVWRGAGTSHHLRHVVEQLAKVR